MIGCSVKTRGGPVVNLSSFVPLCQVVNHDVKDEVILRPMLGSTRTYRIEMVLVFGDTVRQLVMDTVVPIIRRAANDGEIFWNPDQGQIEAAEFAEIDAVVICSS